MVEVYGVHWRRCFDSYNTEMKSNLDDLKRTGMMKSIVHPMIFMGACGTVLWILHLLINPSFRNHGNEQGVSVVWVCNFRCLWQRARISCLKDNIGVISRNICFSMWEQNPWVFPEYQCYSLFWIVIIYDLIGFSSLRVELPE